MKQLEGILMTDELKRLKKMRKLIVSEIENYGQDDISFEMSVIDLQDWLQETDAEISKMLL